MKDAHFDTTTNFKDKTFIRFSSHKDGEGMHIIDSFMNEAQTIFETNLSPIHMFFHSISSFYH